jgi:2-polyprenyl-3-methyl-5-hydroxy-6-metoxy-1,4-benzoquinol methylase
MARPPRGSWSLWRCRECGAAYLDPRPTRSTIALAYEHGYYTHQPLGPVTPGLRSRVRTRMRHGHLNRSLGYDLRPASKLGGALLGMFPRRAEISASSVRHLPFQRAGRVLDVGAGAGGFVALMSEAGWNAEGVDPDPEAAGAARRMNIPVACATVEQVLADGNEEAFDAITMNHVIEHLHDPRSVLETCRRLLKPSGTLWVATPNLDSEGHKRFGRYWVHLDPPRHLILFTRESLEAVLALTGFTDPRLVMTRATSASWSFRASTAIARAERQHPARDSLWARRLVLSARVSLALHPDRTEEVAVIGRRGSRSGFAG